MAKISLRGVVGYEGGTLEWLQKVSLGGEPRLDLAIAVVTQYRRARAFQRSEDESDQEYGVMLMNQFIIHMVSLGHHYLVQGDIPAAWLAEHNKASALHVLGEHNKADVINRQILVEIDGYREEHEVLDEDGEFVELKVFFGLVENNEEYRQQVGHETWGQKVEHMKEMHLPDYPGRVEVYVKYLLEEDLMSKGEASFKIGEVLIYCCDIHLFGKYDQLERLRLFALSLQGHTD